MTRRDALRFIRDEIAHEFSLLNGRISWFASCQAFLISAFAFALGNPAINHAGWLAHFVLPLLGVTLCAATLPGITGAHATIGAWLERQYRLLQDEEARAELSPVLIARLVEAPGLDRTHRRSLWFSAALPGVIGLFWLVSFVLVLVMPISF
ncbi:MAG TPA: hypothetical protein VF169_01055 [Albitalea sp.]|uniref:RipA family octameric membrane protein n=1 Tax=Piscinibacter sp. TaxID=1903157 RepID=UPI002ED1A44F